MKDFLRQVGLVKQAKKSKYILDSLLSRKKWQSLATSNHIQLELGSGQKKGKGGWVTVDLSGADISHDLRKGIPLPDESVDRIYTSHMLEHIPYQALIVFINECWRVLKVGGEFSVSVPNAELFINAYCEKRFFMDPARGYLPAKVDTGSFLDQVNYIAYMGGHHRYMFDEENLLNTMTKAPFSSVVIRDYDAEIDIQARDFVSIYASAIK